LHLALDLGLESESVVLELGGGCDTVRVDAVGGAGGLGVAGDLRNVGVGDLWNGSWGDRKTHGTALHLGPK
jgi:hypothetical protein